jgi:hypothetical protein
MVPCCRPFVLVSVAAASSAVAQVPSHAVRIDPSLVTGEHRILAAGDTVVVVGRTGGAAPDFVHVARSPDGGRTWPVRELPIAWAPRIGTLCGDSAAMHVAVNAMWTGPHLVSSYDGGVTWLPPVRVSAMSNSRSIDVPVVVAEGADVLVLWNELRSVAGLPEVGMVLCNRSTDGGRTWAATDARLDSNTAPATIGSHDVVAAGPERHVLWGEVSLAGSRTLYSRSLDRGATWSPSRVLAATQLVRAAGSTSTLLAADATAAAMLRSADGGTTWVPVVGHGITRVVDLAVHGARVLLVGSETAPAPAQRQILLQVSEDGGASWLPQPYRVPLYRSAGVEAEVTATAAFVHFAFGDQIEPRGAVIQSDDGGVTWRLAVDAGGSAFAADDDRALVVAYRALVSAGAWVFVMAGHTALGVGTAGSGGVVPTLQGRGLPGLGRTFDLEVAGCVGGAQGLVAAGFGPAVDLPLGGARLYVGQPMASLPFVAGGAVGQPGAGGARLTIAVPNTPAVVGVRLLSQAFVVDGGAGFGFAASAARETWIR